MILKSDMAPLVLAEFLPAFEFAGRDLFTNEAIASLINLDDKINWKYLF